LEKSVAPSFPSYETSNMISMKQIGIHSPSHYMVCQMNSYPEKIPPPSSLLGRSAPLNMVGLSELLPGQSDPYANHPAFPIEQFGVALGPPRGAPIVANTIGQSELIIRQSGTTLDHPPFGRTVRIRIRKTYCCTLYQFIIHHSSSTFHPYIFKPHRTI
jgi:hypothetical protein